MKKVSAAQEDYLEAILALESLHGRVRVRDVSERLSVHKSTVTAALKMLTEKGLIEYEPYGRIVLTDIGRRTGTRVQERHETLRAFLRDVLLVDADKAEENACRMEHVVDSVVLDRLEQFTGFMQQPCGKGHECLKGFRALLGAG